MTLRQTSSTLPPVAAPTGMRSWLVRGARAWLAIGWLATGLLAGSALADDETVLDLGSIDGRQGFTLSNDSPGPLGLGDAFGVGGAIGDLNDDGLQDFAWHGSQSGNRAPIFVFFGRSDGFPAAFAVSDLDGANGFVITDEMARLAPAESIERAGDVNGDGIDDLVVGAHRISGTSPDSVGFVLYGRKNGFPAAIDYLDIGASDGFLIGDYSPWPTGATEPVFLRFAGDVNGDGRADLFVGLPAADSEPGVPALSPGASFVIYGRDGAFSGFFDLDDIDGSNGFLIPPAPEPSDAFRANFGRSGGYVGDLNCDGRDDFAIGMPNASGEGTVEDGFGVGRVAVIFGRDDDFAHPFDVTGLAGAGFTVLAAEPDDVVGALGWSLVDLGDFDGDDCDDLLIGSPSGNVPGQANFTTGLGFVVYGATGAAEDVVAETSGGSRVTALVPIEVEIPPDTDVEPDSTGVGLDVAAGDVNGDGRPDAVLGNSGGTTADGRAAAGVSFVVFGREGPRPSAVDLHDLGVFEGYRIVGEAAGDFSGLSIAVADVAGADGRAEVLVAGTALQDDPDGSLIGAVHAVLGGSEPGLFADGFESGETSAWDLAFP